jgi:hypothetical protein
VCDGDGDARRSVHGERFVLPCEYGHVKIPPVGVAQKHFEEEQKLLKFIGEKLYVLMAVVVGVCL